MKKINFKYISLFLIIVLLLLSGFPLSAGKNRETDKIRNLLIRQEIDWNKGDLEAYMDGYWNSDSLLFIGKSGPIYGWKTTLEIYRKSYPDKKSMGKLKFTFLKIELLSDNSAAVIGKWDLKREKDNPNGHFSLVLKKINGKWKIVIDHSS